MIWGGSSSTRQFAASSGQVDEIAPRFATRFSLFETTEVIELG